MTALLPASGDELPATTLPLKLEHPALRPDRVVLETVAQHRDLPSVDRDLALAAAQVLPGQRCRIPLPLLVDRLRMTAKVLDLEYACARPELRRTDPLRRRIGAATACERKENDDEEQPVHVLHDRR